MSKPLASPLATQDQAEARAAELGADPALVGNFGVIQQDASALAEAAEKIGSAATGAELSQALDHNLRLWVAIRQAIGDPTNALPQEIRANLLELARFVIDTTLSAGRGQLDPGKVETLATINLNIAHGLTLSQRTELIRERAYQLWETEGRPDGHHEAHWLQAEQDINKALITD